MALVGGSKRAAPAVLTAFATLCVAFGGPIALAQATASGNPVPSAGMSPNQNPAKSAPHPARNRKRAAKVKAEVPPDPAPLTQIATPPPPDWPVNDKAVPASVDWNGRVLSISATNSSLSQILSDVSTATGVKVEGAPTDQRVYGSYGPAPARDVLSQLLDGSGYNVLMIGDQGEGTPRTLVLTLKSNTATPNAGGNAQPRQNSDEDVEEPEQPEQPDPVMHRPPGFNRSPQQLQQELQQRMQQQQQQGAPLTPPPAPQTPPN
jgi:hypothetical protein